MIGSSGVNGKTVVAFEAGCAQMQCHPLPGRMSAIKTMMVWRDDYQSRKLDCLRPLLSGRG